METRSVTLFPEPRPARLPTGRKGDLIGITDVNGKVEYVIELPVPGKPFRTALVTSGEVEK
ncbi:MAG: hypothetical protein EOR43_18240 [Mesorhizobium sp.]|uniref:hypothetical protein n=1 Tax=Mesorhizobium sp. TaxID=1871066 RepID=UPI000FE2E39C|nr:hypothetical protein [Mesorhizobium sp.]RWK21838.1 MAG: hypothetical protein EOR43_18240 [Mesorhizobium sp.]RWK29927.1 MAG: hypothetical protein EOR44_18660 [Mesorhizobium sp.]